MNKLGQLNAHSLVEFARRVAVETKHGPKGRDGDGPCDNWCVRCEAERILEREAADVSASSVTDEQLLRFGRELPRSDSPIGSSSLVVDRNAITRHKVCVALGLVSCRPEDRARSLADVVTAINEGRSR